MNPLFRLTNRALLVDAVLAMLMVAVPAGAVVLLPHAAAPVTAQSAGAVGGAAAHSGHDRMDRSEA